jgi:hypothetical protein
MMPAVIGNPVLRVPGVGLQLAVVVVIGARTGGQAEEQPQLSSRPSTWTEQRWYEWQKSNKAAEGSALGAVHPASCTATVAFDWLG